jgi:hypothetical protein
VREELIEMIEKRVSDGSVLRLIGKWIKDKSSRKVSSS